MWFDYARVTAIVEVSNHTSPSHIGIIYLPVDPWVKGYMGMGITFTVGSTISLTKTQRDIHEAGKLTSKIEEAKLEKILAEHNGL